MSQVARVFVVLNLLVAAGFLFAAATFLASNEAAYVSGASYLVDGGLVQQVVSQPAG